MMPGYFILFLLSCQSKNNRSENEVRIAKMVPGNYVNASDTLLNSHQDTIYYGNVFFTGYRYELYPDGDTAVLESFFNGVEEGVQRKWYPGNLLAEERFYINGKKEGTHHGWWPNGNPKFEFAAVNNEYKGEFKEWYVSGLLGKQFHYRNGQEEGSQRLWWDNGTVRANYVIKHGKKYGLIGLKACINPYDSVIKK
jgi:antitoxin component YwqK of YwqJK toxin-antitoxin module